jgi:hypothetical protein
VGVVGDGHELGEARLTKEGVVDVGEVNHLQGEWLLTEVLSGWPKVTLSRMNLRGMTSFPDMIP